MADEIYWSRYTPAERVAILAGVTVDEVNAVGGLPVFGDHCCWCRIGGGSSCDICGAQRIDLIERQWANESLDE